MSDPDRTVQAEAVAGGSRILPAASACLLAVLLAGCATTPREGGARVADWESPEPAVVPEPAPAVPAPSVPANPPAETWIPLHRWCQANGLVVPCPLGTAPASGCTLNTPDGALVLRAGSQSAYWNGLELRLLFPPQTTGGQLCVHTLDLAKTIEPLARTTFTGGLKSNATIVIDPGHGGADSGAKSVLGYRCEKDFTLDWARRLEPLLVASGWQVFLTRSGDADLSLSNRVACAEAHKADVFLSLHFNSAAPDEHEAGLETYCLTPSGMPSTVTRGYGDDAALAFPNNAFDAQNLQFAVRVHRALLQVNGRLDRGVRRARYLGVLRGQNRPAILVEGGYLSNPREARRIAEPAFRQQLAAAIAQALALNPEAQSPRTEAGHREREVTSQTTATAASQSLSR